MFKLQVPADKVSLIIGTHGATIKDVQQRTGAFLDIEKTMPQQYNQSSSSSPALRQITISGTQEQIEAAKSEINRIIGTTAGIREYRDDEFAGNTTQMNASMPPNMQPGTPMGMLMGMRAMFNSAMDYETMRQFMESQMYYGMAPPNMPPPNMPPPSDAIASSYPPPPPPPPPAAGDEADYPPPGM